MIRSQSYVTGRMVCWTDHLYVYAQMNEQQVNYNHDEVDDVRWMSRQQVVLQFYMDE